MTGLSMLARWVYLVEAQLHVWSELLIASTAEFPYALQQGE